MPSTSTNVSEIQPISTIDTKETASESDTQKLTPKTATSENTTPPAKQAESTGRRLKQALHKITTEKNTNIATIVLLIFETTLVALALIPAQMWTRLLPQSSGAALNGPFPPTIAPLIAVLLYLLPALIGFLCRDWKRALLFATLPAWIGLGFFLAAATSKIGIFYLVSADHVKENVSVLELFAVLGGMGWLTRQFFKLR
ncbi:hypothetical protein [Ktedonospora formicarum]|uniref:Uncharacterized protein n=1 Tax=Ktedonospora formicarum TaxID=2778364 RepID=A0A8J3MUK1_9CHLR|nr:hypothetical protein [Ktedonospora formicarum]GHO45485.1 hypothetical protein KSX_36480 [Ktedonospora formicarum]